MYEHVLALKWRPKTFADVVGQSHVLTALTNSLATQRLHHAYLFSGTRGVGKTSIARLFAKGLNCTTGMTSSPCGSCENCQEIEQGRFVDLIEIDAASRTKVEDTRELLDNVQYLPVRGRFKIYLIDEVHMLSRHSFNALLKTLEEPPPYVKFLLATTDPHKLPVTVLSRCLQFNLKALDKAQIEQQLAHILQQEQHPFEPRALELLARSANGSLRDALSLTDQAIALSQGKLNFSDVAKMLGHLDESQPLALIESLIQQDGNKIMKLINQLAQQAVDWDTLLQSTLAQLHQLAMRQLLTQPSVTPHENHLQQLAQTLAPEELQRYYQILLIGRQELPFAPDQRMGVEMTFLRALAFSPKKNVLPSSATTAVTGSLLTSATEATQSPAPITKAEESTPLPSRTEQQSHVQNNLSSDTSQLLAARQQLRKQKETVTAPPASVTTPLKKKSPLTVTNRSETTPAIKPATETATASRQAKKEDAYRWQAKQDHAQPQQEKATPAQLRADLEHEKSPELLAKIKQQVIKQDDWSAELDRLTLPKLVEQLALNAWKEENTAHNLVLHLRSKQAHLNTPQAQEALKQALATARQTDVSLSIINDDDPQYKTPNEWRQATYLEKLNEAQQMLQQDPHIKTLCDYFDAQLDEESIQPR